MINNKEYYKITGVLKADFKEDVTNPIIKIATSLGGVEKDGLLT